MGGKSSSAPDYRPLAQASKEAAEIMSRLGNRQLDFARQQYDDMRPVLQGIADNQIAMQNQTMRQGQDYYDYQQSTFRPVERDIVAKAREFNTDAYQEGLARQARADSERAFAQQDATNERRMMAMGVNPNSGRFQGLARQQNLAQAAAAGNAMTATRTQADAMADAKMMQAAGLGRNLPGASIGAYGAALQAGNSAGANARQPGMDYMAGMAQGANTIGAGQQMQLAGLGNVLNAQTQWAVSQANNQSDMFGALVGGGMGLVSGSKWWGG